MRIDPRLLVETFFAIPSQAGKSAGIPPTSGQSVQLAPIPQATSLDGLVKAGISELASILEYRESLLKTLPEPVRKSVIDLIANSYSLDILRENQLKNLTLAAKTIQARLGEVLQILLDEQQVTGSALQAGRDEVAFTQQKISETLYKLIASFDAGDKSTFVAGEQRPDLSFFVPIYFERAGKPYPAYVHVYHDNRFACATDEAVQRDIWLRVCLMTEHMGPLEAIFHLCGNNQLNIRLTTSPATCVSIERDELHKRLVNLPLAIGDIILKTTAETGDET
ncbi:MAG: hypothetical protein N2491_13390 [Negativicutes bacterium]|nr:hypothetical protein [Negativicutes bacterium]